LIITGSIYFILLDELIIGSAQRRIGPLNVGWYGIPSSIINGCNLIITQLIIPKLHFYFGFQSFPIFFFLLSIISYNIIYPFYLINLILSLVLIIIISGLSILFIILSAFSGNSKYSMLGCIRIISQLVSLELIWTTILSFFITSFNETSIAGSFLCSYYIIYFIN
jgi:NADH:ubiquinone oxidoreductase subunit H